VPSPHKCKLNYSHEKSTYLFSICWSAPFTKVFEWHSNSNIDSNIILTGTRVNIWPNWIPLAAKQTANLYHQINSQTTFTILSYGSTIHHKLNIYYKPPWIKGVTKHSPIYYSLPKNYSAGKSQDLSMTLYFTSILTYQIQQSRKIYLAQTKLPGRADEKQTTPILLIPVSVENRKIHCPSIHSLRRL